MATLIRVLAIEDSEDHTRLLLNELKYGGYNPHFRRLDAPETMETALTGEVWDVVIFGCVMSRFSWQDALKIVKNSGINLPLIVVSADTGGETAAKAMKSGADNYVIRSTLARLVCAVNREFPVNRESREQIVHQQEEEKLRIAHQQLMDIIEFLPHATLAVDKDKKVIAWNRAIEEMTGVPKEEIIGKGNYAYAVPFYGYPRPFLIDVFFSGEKEMGIYYKAIERRGNSLYAETFAPVLYDGKGAFLRPAATPLFDGKGNIAGAVETIHDITDNKRKEEQIREQLAMEEAVSNACRLLLTPEGSHLDEVLRVMGQAVSADRAYIFEFRGNGKKMDNTYEWCAPGIDSQSENLKDIEMQMFPWWMKKLESRESIVLHDIEALPPDASKEKESLRAQGIRSLLVVPIHSVAGNLVGFMGFDDTQKCRVWSPEDVRFLWVVAEMVSIYWEEKRAEEALHRSEVYFRSLIENALDLIVILDRYGLIKYISPAVERVLGYRHEELIDKKALAFVHPEDMQNIVDIFNKTIQNPLNPRKSEFRVRHKNKSWRILEVIGQNLLDNPAVAGVVANCRDITERKRAENALQQSEQKLRYIVENSTNLFFSHTPGNIITYMSQQSSKYIDCEPDEAMVNWTAFLTDNQVNAEGVLYTQRAIETGKTQPVYELELIGKKGRKIWVQVNETPVVQNGETVAVVGALTDITGRKVAEEALKKSYERLKKTLDETVNALSVTVETRDPYTAGHQWRVSQLACAIAQEMGLPGETIEGVRVAGILHDIGKIYVPLEILNKPGKITEIEIMLIKNHPKVGYDILKKIVFDWPVTRTVLQHHERIDGSGYPFGLLAGDILMEARILAVADVVEAMSSHRPYRSALGLEAALIEIVRHKDVLYDGNVVGVCLKLIQEKRFSFDNNIPN